METIRGLCLEHLQVRGVDSAVVLKSKRAQLRRFHERPPEADSHGVPGMAW